MKHVYTPGNVQVPIRSSVFPKPSIKLRYSVSPYIAAAMLEGMEQLLELGIFSAFGFITTRCSVRKSIGRIESSRPVLVRKKPLRESCNL